MKYKLRRAILVSLVKSDHLVNLFMQISQILICTKMPFVNFYFISDFLIMYIIKIYIRNN